MWVRIMRRWAVIAVAAAVAAVPWMAGTAEATVVVGSWHMDEGSGAARMSDSTTNNLDGSVGNGVITGIPAGSSRAYHFGSGRDRLVTVSDAGNRLDPGSHAMRLNARIRSTSLGEYNVIQKGQSHTPGGYYKISWDRGHLYCTFRGSPGRSASIGWPYGIADGRYHDISCARNSRAVYISVDGHTRGRAVVIGPISNFYPLSIGGKVRCGGSIECDYFSGDIDSVAFLIA